MGQVQQGPQDTQESVSADQEALPSNAVVLSREHSSQLPDMGAALPKTLGPSSVPGLLNHL